MREKCLAGLRAVQDKVTGMFVLVSYDIVDDRRRAKTSRLLLAFGDRVQRSVFECNLDEKELQKLVKKLTPLIDRREDSARIYRLCAGCKAEVRIVGTGTVSEDPDLVIV